MPTYDLVCIARTTPTLLARATASAASAASASASQDAPAARPAEDIVIPLARTAATFVLDRGGVVRGFRSLGQRELPYRMKNHQVVFSQGYYWSMQFDASPEHMAALRKALAFDERVIRHGVLRVGSASSSSSSLKVATRHVPPAKMQ